MSFTPPISDPIMPDCASLFISLQSVHARIHLDNRVQGIKNFGFISQIYGVLLPLRPESIHLTLLPHTVPADEICGIGPRHYLINEVGGLRQRLDGFVKMKITLMDNVDEGYDNTWWAMRALPSLKDSCLMFDVQHSSGTYQLL